MMGNSVRWTPAADEEASETSPGAHFTKNYELITEILWKFFCSIIYSTNSIRSQICTCHGMCKIGIWSGLNFHLKTKCIFTKFALWPHVLEKWVSCCMQRWNSICVVLTHCGLWHHMVSSNFASTGSVDGLVPVADSMLIVNCILQDKLRWKINQYLIIFSPENAFENVQCLRNYIGTSAFASRC